MAPKLREKLQLAILRVLDANDTRFGLALDAITLLVSCEGFERIHRDDVRPELEYLVEKGLVAEVSKLLEPAEHAWKRTAAGRDYLSERMPD